MGCERCDGNHPTAECNHYRRPRLEHPDAQPLPPGERPLPTTTSSSQVDASGKLIKQPADGSCLYHTLVFGLRHANLKPPPASHLRLNMATWAALHARLVVHGKTLHTWLRWEAGGSESYQQYCDRQALCGWDGVIEIIVATRMFQVAVAVWVPLERCRFRRTALFEPDGAAKATIHVCRTGGVHYDYLELAGATSGSNLRSDVRRMLNHDSAPCHSHARCGQMWGEWSLLCERNIQPRVGRWRAHESSQTVVVASSEGSQRLCQRTLTVYGVHTHSQCR